MNKENTGPLIMAKTVEEFNTYKELYDKLPEQVKKRICKLKSSVITLVDCIFDTEFQDNYNAYLPKDVTQISDIGDRVVAYSKDYLFIIEKKDGNPKKIDYYFV